MPILTRLKTEGKALKERRPMTTPPKPVTPEVKHTTDYSQFRTLKGNRPVAPRHVQQIVDSFQANPGLIELRPILVNEKLEVVDGQHRLKAAEMLGLRLPYIIAPGLDIATAQTMNALQRPWNMLDFANSYAYAGNPNYQKFLRYMEDYFPIRANILLKYLGGQKAKSHWDSAMNFRLGKFTFPVDPTEADNRLGKLSGFADLGNDWWYTEPFAAAFLTAMKVEGYDHDRMLAGYVKADVKRQPTTQDSLRELERAYNFNKVNVKRFF